METRLTEARTRHEAEPNNVDAIIWLGRRLGYLGRFTEAIEVYKSGIEKFPRDARLYRHRGHRYITLRRFDLAIADLNKAASLVKEQPDEVEPDGQPNARNIPTSTLQFNIWYHLALAQYLTGRNKAALNSYRECLKVSKNPDSIVATTHWLYMTLRRMNRLKEATQVLEPIRTGMDIIENDGYYQLVLMYKGLADADALLSETLKQASSPGSYSILYGIANWHLYNGRREKAVGLLRQIVSGNQWTSFGYIAAEADLLWSSVAIPTHGETTALGSGVAIRSKALSLPTRRDSAGALQSVNQMVRTKHYLVWSNAAARVQAAKEPGFFFNEASS